MKSSLFYFSMCFFTFLAIGSEAQKIPNKQETSVWAPSNIKIDGKANDWNNTYQAHNTATQISYTIANDNKNLYLSVYLTDASSIFYKVMTGGITLVLKTAQQESSIRYPVFSYKDLPSMIRPDRGLVFSEDKEDSLIIKNNATFANKAKDIEVKGIKNIDTLISLFNEHGIKTAARLDAKLGYHYELCIPLKYLEPLINGNNLKYQILINGGPAKYSISVADLPHVNSGTRPDGTPIPQSELDGVNVMLMAARNARYATTDFSGEYTLAKKP